MNKDLKIIDLPFYYKFIPDDEIYQFESDLGEKKYQIWIEKYPTELISIFGSLINLAGHLIRDNDVLYFKEKGVDLNTASNVYPSDAGGSTPLGSACEYRYYKLIKALIKYGADLNLEDQNGFVPLESILTGHRYSDCFDIKSCEKCVKILINAGANNSIQNGIIDDFCGEYKKKSTYLSNLFKKSEVRIPINNSFQDY